MPRKDLPHDQLPWTKVLKMRWTPVSPPTGRFGGNRSSISRYEGMTRWDLVDRKGKPIKSEIWVGGRFWFYIHDGRRMRPCTETEYSGWVNARLAHEISKEIWEVAHAV